MSRALDVAIKAAEQQQATEMTTKFSARMQAAVQDLGSPDGFRHTILSYVAKENYEKATEELNKYVNSKDEYPQFKVRTDRYKNYAVDLINAVKAKRSFPGLQHLATSKQQDLFDRAMDHFDDLKVTLKKIEQIEREVRIQDIRSTVLVIKAVVYCAIALALVAFVIELSRGVVPTANNVLDGYFSDMTNWIFDKLHL